MSYNFTSVLFVMYLYPRYFDFSIYPCPYRAIFLLYLCNVVVLKAPSLSVLHYLFFYTFIHTHNYIYTSIHEVHVAYHMSSAFWSSICTYKICLLFIYNACKMRGQQVKSSSHVPLHWLAGHKLHLQKDDGGHMNRISCLAFVQWEVFKCQSNNNLYIILRILTSKVKFREVKY